MQYRFDKYVLDTEQLYLTADGEPVAAEARQLQLLSLLIAGFPECCERTALLEALWPNTVVSHWSLGRLVSDTRKLFRELGYEGPLIQTLHGRGYRLSPELAEQLQDICPSSPQPESDALAADSAEPAESGSDSSTSATGAAAVDSAPAGEQVSSPSSAAASRPTAHFWRLWTGMGLLVLVTALVVYLVTVRQIPDDGAPLVIGEAPDVRGRILWVDDNPDNNLAERAQFESLRIAVYLATNTDDALTLLSMYRYDAVISDMGRGREPLAGFKLMERMRARHDSTPYFLYTIMPSDSQRQLVRQRGGNGVAVAPDELFSLVLPIFDLPAAETQPSASPP
ncbi:winged helix-turn-helix domain-containing protein [Microbulbifer mangrovi]|uniref:winged helix-turn-helix domain-containing protein n=1 Tax=Microbulbifer mangrovi TaxID=927787 RepID=UPI00099038A1|nr:winged helix-turn-helix domain-containing protein [Microbulbifer mangrovi]